MKILLHYASSRKLTAFFRQRAGAYAACVVDPADPAGLARELTDTDVLLHVLTPVTAAMMDMAPQLKLIQKIGVGVDAIDRPAAQARSIRIANMPGTNSQAVAEMTLLLLLACLRKLVWLDCNTRDGDGWALSPAGFDGLGEIAGRTIGFVGYGQVPRRLSPALQALGGKVLYYDVRPVAGAEMGWRPFETLLGECDVISLHLPLTDLTRLLIDDAALARMKPGAILINTARGELVDEEALVKALRNGRLRAAGIDTFAREPLPPDHPLMALENVVLTPHVAWLTPETIARSLDVALENCRRIVTAEPLLHEVVL